jgi:hypothetical protein
MSGLDFLTDDPPACFAAIITNPPHTLHHEFIERALLLMDAGIARAVVLLQRWDHLMAECVTPVLNRAFEIRVCTWRPRWIPDSTGNGRWSSCWITWRRDYDGPPMHSSSARPKTERRTETMAKKQRDHVYVWRPTARDQKAIEHARWRCQSMIERGYPESAQWLQDEVDRLIEIAKQSPEESRTLAGTITWTANFGGPGRPTTRKESK